MSLNGCSLLLMLYHTKAFLCLCELHQGFFLWMDLTQKPVGWSWLPFRTS